MKKMVKIVIVILVLVLVYIGFGPLKAGFRHYDDYFYFPGTHYKKIPRTRTLACAYKSHTNEFDINDVTLEFFYGNAKISHSTKANIAFIKGNPITNNTEESNSILIKEIDNFQNGKYLFVYGHDRIRYRHSENITISSDAFRGTSGYIIFIISESTDDLNYDGEYNTKNNNIFSIASTRINIYYFKEGDKVYLSNERINTKPNQNQKLENGFSVPSKQNYIEYYGGYKSYRRIFNKDNVTLDFYYGSNSTSENKLNVDLFDMDVCLFFEKGNTPNLNILNYHDDPNYIKMKTVDNYIAENYDTSYKYRPFGFAVEYKHSEKITIPKEAFTGNKGTISFIMVECLTFHEGGDRMYGNASYIEINYIVIGNYVYLSAPLFK